MRETEKCDESRQLNIQTGHLQKDRVELESYAKAPSISVTSDNRQNARSEYHYGLLEKIISNENLNEAFKRVKKNKGSHGIDKMGVDELLPYLRSHGEELRQSIADGSYKPNPVRRVEIPKDNGKTRPLGIPTVVDRVIQQAISQVLTPVFEKKFSENSYGFRPNRNAHQSDVQENRSVLCESNRMRHLVKDCHC